MPLNTGKIHVLTMYMKNLHPIYVARAYMYMIPQSEGECVFIVQDVRKENTQIVSFQNVGKDALHK